MQKGFFFIPAVLATVFFLPLFGQTEGKKNKNNNGYQFSNEIVIPTTPVKDQANSGTCWSFATTSFIETEIMRLSKSEYDLSEMFFVRYAYPQKAQKYIRYQGHANFSEGGQAHDAFNVINLHGMVPEEAYSGFTRGFEYHDHAELVKVMTGILDNSLDDKESYTGKCLEVIDSSLGVYLGDVPEKFTYKGSEYTPKSFAATIGFIPSDYIELTSYSIYPFYKFIDLEIPDNWSHNTYLNVPINEFMDIINNALAKGYSVNWDGDISDPGFSHENGIAIVPERNPLNMNKDEKTAWELLNEDEKQKMLFDFSKPRTEMVINQDTRQKSFDNFKTTDDHLMHIIGKAYDQNGNLYYLTKNSWATYSNSLGGKLYMSEAFVRLRTVAIQVHKDAIPASIKAKINLN